MDLIVRLEYFPSNKGLLFRAIDAFQELHNIRRFFEEYIDYTGKNGKSFLAQNNPKEAAVRNIVYVLGFCKKEISDGWRKALPEIDPFYKEFYQPYSRKLRKRMY